MPQCDFHFVFQEEYSCVPTLSHAPRIVSHEAFEIASETLSAASPDFLLSSPHSSVSLSRIHHETFSMANRIIRLMFVGGF